MIQAIKQSSGHADHMHFKRHELKFYLNPIQTESLACKLKHVMDYDKHGDSHGEYLVRSLYFDSPDDECLYQKQSGFLRRKKIRLRTYGRNQQSPVKFEIKHKYGSIIFKESQTLSCNHAKNLCDGKYSVLLSENSALLDKGYAIMASRAYSPKVIVEYTRQAFVSPALNLRITLDKDLRANNNSTDIFSGKHGATPVILEGKHILEIKYDHYMPTHIKRILSCLNAERSAISKYTLSRRFQKLKKWEDN